MSFLSATGGGGVDASGGTTVTDVNIGGVDYRIHAFENVGSDTFTVNSGGEVDVLVVGGGGGGGGYGGGGGGGAVLHSVDRPVQSGSYTVTVGDGGAGRPLANSSQGRVGLSHPSAGDSSSVFGLTATGGGAAGTWNNRSGGNGGNGGGCGAYGLHGTSTFGLGQAPAGDQFTTVHAGFDGGIAFTDPDNFPCAGGGGANEEGGTQNNPSGPGSDGGDGIQINIDGNNYYWGGGGGGCVYRSSGSGGDGGLGGGGGGAQFGSGGGSALNAGGTAGAYYDKGGAGGENTGGGGGGGNYDSGNSDETGAPGGSGIVIIRYEI